MYHCELQIAVFSMDPMIAETVRSIQPLEHFSHKIITVQEPSEDVLKSSDVVVWNLDTTAVPSKLREKCKEGAALIFCGNHPDIDRLRNADLEAVDEFFELPLNRERVRLRMKRLLEHRKLCYDLDMTQTYLDTAIDSIPDMLWFKSLNGTHVKVNKAFCSVVGKPREDVTGKDHCYIWGVSPDDYENGEASCKESEDAVMRARKTLQFTEEVKCSRGMRQLRTYKTPILDRDKETILGTVGIGHDVTDLVNMSAEIEILLQSMPYAILIWNNKGEILNVNAKFEEYFRTNKENVIGRDYGRWIADAFEERRTINGEGFVEARVSLADGQGKMLEIHENFIYDIFHNIAGKLCIFRDVTVERDLESQILHSSNTDFLTGLYNRRCFYQYIHNNRGDKMVSLIYIDLDRFKGVNDTYGHKIGDAVLVKTAEILREIFQEDFVARLGGDEFLVVRLGECGISTLVQETGRFLEKVREVFGKSESLGGLSASAGIAQSRDSDMDIDLLLQHSDLALYQAKNEGRSRYCIYEEDRR